MYNNEVFEPFYNLIQREIIYTANANIQSISELTIVNQPNTSRNYFARMIWATKIAGPSTEMATTTAIDNNNNIVIAGIYHGDASTGSSLGNPVNFYDQNNFIGKTIYTTGNYDVFVAKYTPDGFVIWNSKIIGTTSDTKLSLSIDNHNNIVLTGFYENTKLDIYNSYDQCVATLPSSSGINCFIVKYNENGMVLWVNTIVSTSIVVINSVKTD